MLACTASISVSMRSAARKKASPLGGQVAAIGAANEKARLQRLLQRADAAAERRVVDAEAAGGGRICPVRATARNMRASSQFMTASDFNFCTTVPYRR